MYTHALVNLAHRQRTVRAGAAAVRILGLFQSEQEAKTHAASNPCDVNVYLIPMKKWFVIMRSEDGDENAAQQAITTAYKARLKAHEDEFLDNTAKQQSGEVTGGCPRVEIPIPADACPPETLSRSSEVRLQSFAVISCMLDYRKGGDTDRTLQEPSCIIWGAYDTEVTAQEAIKGNLACHIKDVHLDTVAMYEWLYPTLVETDELKEEFRDPQLTAIIEHRKKERKEVDAFREKCREQQCDVPEINVARQTQLQQTHRPIQMLENALTETEEVETTSLGSASA